MLKQAFEHMLQEQNLLQTYAEAAYVHMLQE